MIYPTDRSDSVQPAAQNGKVRLDFLDGIRGCAAIFVAAFHALLFTGHGDLRSYSSAGRIIAFFLSFGHYAVAVFIVLSGFCLAIPVAKSKNKELTGGFRAYIGRRALRILPPYYAALVLFLLMIAFVPQLQRHQHTAWDSKIPVTAGAVLSHILLVHNVSDNSVYKVDGPMWSVATEWQIYFMFPLMLIPVWRRLGITATVFIAIFAGVTLHFLPHSYNGLNLDLAHFWFLGLFALGMGAAAIAFETDPTFISFKYRFRWGQIATFSSICLLSALLSKQKWMEEHDYLVETCVGIVAAAFILHWTVRMQTATEIGTSLRFLNSPWIVWLGSFSYSIYLIHSPLLGLFNLLTLSLPLTPNYRLAIMLAVALPFVVACSYLFHILIERRFLSGHQQLSFRRTEQKCIDVETATQSALARH